MCLPYFGQIFVLADVFIVYHIIVFQWCLHKLLGIKWYHHVHCGAE